MVCSDPLGRRFGRGQVVGPVLASCDEDAIAVVAPHLAAQEGHFVGLDTHEPTGHDQISGIYN